MAKDLLARAGAQAQAGKSWRHSLRDGHLDAAEADWLLGIAAAVFGQAREMTVQGAADARWRDAFDAGGWSNAPRIAAAAMLTSLITEIAERVLATPSSPDLPSQPVRRR